MGLHEILKSGRISHNICTPPFVGISLSIEPETVNTSALKRGPQTVLKSLMVRAYNAPHRHLSLPLLPLSVSLYFIFPSLSVHPLLFPLRVPARELFMEGITAVLMTTCLSSTTVLCHARPSSKHSLVVLRGHIANW